jgi:signal transduction histidine kinase
MPVTLLIAGFAGYSIARRALIPLDTMAARAQQISAHNLNERLVVENEHDELGHMGRVFNHLLDRLEQAFSQLQRFTADAAHELRTPLASVRAAGEVALQSPSSQEGYREAISTMLEETVRLNQTIDGLLMLSKAEATHAGLGTSSFLLRDIVTEILVLLDVVIDERKVIVQEDEEAPSSGPIIADRSLVRVALLNVLHNAVKFCHPNSVLRIRYGRVVSDGTHFEQVWIENSGPPIQPGDHERVFARFYTGSSPSTDGKTGAGLGLSIAKLVIERSGGRIGFDQTVTTGARCLIEFPAPPSHA